MVANRTGPWIREHDEPGRPHSSSATIKGPQSLKELIEICASRPVGVRLKAAGSHWALSDAAVSDGEFIETNDPSDMQQHNPNVGFSALGRTLFNVVPGCLNPTALQDLDRAARANPKNVPYYIHVESGKRIYQLYSELDLGDENNSASLAFKMNAEFRNQNFTGSWAFETLGGAGGQTIVGALTTGTHGGDVHLPPVSDSVRAIHLVADGGKHYWIEPERPSWIPALFPGQPYTATFTSDQQLHNQFDQTNLRLDPQLIAKFPDAGKFEIIRNDDTFNAVLVSAGRFGIIYSVVLQAVRQYFLREVRSITDWQTVKEALLDPTNPIFQTNRFVQVAICLTPHDNGTKNKCGITVRNLVPAPSLPDLQLMPWDGSVPTSGKNLMVAGTDNNGLLHFRIFEEFFKPTTDTDETQLPPLEPTQAEARAAAIAALKQNLPALLPPHVLTEREKWQVMAEVISIVGVGALNTFGRTERIGKIIDNPNPDPRLNAPRFEKAGTSPAYDPDGSSSFLEKACSNADFMETLVQGVIDEIEEFVHDNKAAIGGTLATVATIGGVGLPQLIPALLVILALLLVFLELLKHLPFRRLGQVLDLLRHLLLDQPTDPLRAAGAFVWRAVGVKLFETQQGFHDYTGFSYAVMDGHDYADLNCSKSVESIEVFFDATDRKMLAFVDLVLAMEARRHFSGQAAVGYISLRYMSQSRALIGMARHPLTVSLEVSALRDVVGSTEFVQHARRVALNENFGGILHWGQDNTSTVADIERLFNATPGGDLHRWRAALSRLTDNGRLDGFSSQFTRNTGLEVVEPLIDGFSAKMTGTASNRTITAKWDCFRNPPGTTVRIRLKTPSGSDSFHSQNLLRGTAVFPVVERGNYRLTLFATITAVNNQSREVLQAVTVNVT